MLNPSSNIVGFVVSNEKSASYFASCAKKLIKSNVAVQVFASLSAMQKFQQLGISAVALEKHSVVEKIANSCSVVVINSNDEIDFEMQRALPSSVFIIDSENLDRGIPDGSSEVVCHVMKVAQKMLVKATVEAECLKLRISKYETLSRHLESMSEEELAELIASNEILYSGTGGPVRVLKIKGEKVFVKQVPLNAFERRHRGCTENLFQLPSYYQYGVGSAGFSAWRELEAHRMTTKWVVSGGISHFPLMYHSRILSKTEECKVMDEKEFGGHIKYWGSSEAIEKRLRANEKASAYVTLFMECIPQDLQGWLEGIKDPKERDKAFAMIERDTQAVVPFMSEKGMLHFDAHFGNILTDGKQLYFSDFGLTICSKFALSKEEREFFEDHQIYDRCYLAQQITNQILQDNFDVKTSDFILEEFASGKIPEQVAILTPFLSSTLQRYAPIALIMNRFVNALREDSKKSVPFPKEELEQYI